MSGNVYKMYSNTLDFIGKNLSLAFTSYSHSKIFLTFAMLPEDY